MIRPRKKVRPPIEVMRDGRDVCNLDTVRGRNAYEMRRKIAWERDGGICGWCQKPVRIDEATSDHLRSRGMSGGFRDDRLENIRAVHLICNSERGSMRYLTRAEWVANKNLPRL